MPVLSRDLVFLAFLILLITIHSLLSSELANEHEQSSVLTDVFTEMDSSKFIYQILWIAWIRKYVNYLISGEKVGFPDDGKTLGECPALEVLRYKYPKGYYGRSTQVRKHRPKNVNFRVGQVVQFEEHYLIGVIIAWDEKYQGPPVDTVHESVNEHEPYYAVLFDEKLEVRQSYVAQSFLKVTKVKIKNKELSNYFENFDGAQYIMQPWLQALYPMD